MATKDPSLTVPTHLEQKEDVESEAMKAVKEKLVNGTESMTSNALGPFDIGVEVPSDLEFPRLLPTILEQLKIIPDMDDIIEMQGESPKKVIRGESMCLLAKWRSHSRNLFNIRNKL